MALTLLIDASSLIYRAWFALPDSIRSPDGDPVNAVHGFTDMLARLIATYRPDRAACAFDDDWRPQWRVDLVPEYKTHRLAAEGEPVAGPEEQIPLVRELLTAGGIACAGAEGFEAEDVIGTLAEREAAKGRRVAVVSGDRDLFGLVRDPDIFVLYPRKGVSDLAVVDEAEIERRYAIPGRVYADFAVLRGDPSDGLPGVPGIGEKTAGALIRAHGTLDAVLEAAKDGSAGALGKVAMHRDYVRRAARVVQIQTTVPVGRVATRLPAAMAPAMIEAGRRMGVSGPVQRLTAALQGLAK